MKIFCVILCLFLLVPGMHGSDGGVEGLLEILLHNGTITREQYDQIARQTHKDSSPPADVKITTDGGLQASTYDGRFAFNLGGVFASDTVLYREDKNPLGSGTEIRSARVILGGVLYSDWEFDYSMEFSDAAVEIKDAFLNYRGFSHIDLQLGHFKPFFSLEQIGSRKHTTFMERGLPNALTHDRKIGIGATFRERFWTASAGFFGENYGMIAGNEGDEGWTTTGRFIVTPVQAAGRLWHFGASIAYQRFGDDKEWRIRSRPESHLTGTRYLHTGRMRNARDMLGYGIESAVILGPFSIQGEYLRTSLNMEGGNETPSFHGAYIFGSWLITGESRNYRTERGVFGRVRPDRSYGAFELAVRYSFLDLNSPPSVAGGREDNITIAFNWYLNRNIRLMTNVILVDNDEYATGNGKLHANDNPGIFQARFQIAF
jgi:phosphate-selective porin OprO and OprP